MLNNNIFFKRILSKFKGIFNNGKGNDYSKVIVIEREDEKFSNESVNRIEHIKDSTKNDVADHNNINKKYLTVDDYVMIIKEKCEKKIALSNIDVQIWYRFNKYDLSKFTKERIEEYEAILCEVIQYMQDYFNEKNISWFEDGNNCKDKISNDISFVIRYSENLLRRKYENKRVLSYEKFKDINKLEKYLDNKFKHIINARTNEVISNIPDELFELDIDDVILNENTFNIESMNKHSITSEEEKVAINKEKDIKIEEILIDNKELDSILSDIENFEI